MNSIEQFQFVLMRRLLSAGRRRARRYILGGGGAHRSVQLAKEMDFFITADISRGFLYIDPYWAIYFHDGRRAINREKGQSSLIWYRDKTLDPRLNSGKTPNRASNLRHLTSSELREAIAEGRVIIRRKVRRVLPTPFFDNDAGGGMVGFKAEAGAIVKEEFRKFMLAELQGELERVHKLSLTLAF